MMRPSSFSKGREIKWVILRSFRLFVNILRDTDLSPCLHGRGICSFPWTTKKYSMEAGLLSLCVRLTSAGVRILARNCCYSLGEQYSPFRMRDNDPKSVPP